MPREVGRRKRGSLRIPLLIEASITTEDQSAQWKAKRTIQGSVLTVGRRKKKQGIGAVCKKQAEPTEDHHCLWETAASTVSPDSEKQAEQAKDKSWLRDASRTKMRTRTSPHVRSTQNHLKITKEQAKPSVRLSGLWEESRTNWGPAHYWKASRISWALFLAVRSMQNQLSIVLPMKSKQDHLSICPHCEKHSEPFEH